jgi:hypothetical protein
MLAPHQYIIALQSFQSERLRRDHADLAVEPQYQALATFFFDEMYGPGDFSARDKQARRLHEFVHLAPGLALHDVEQVLQLLALTNKLDATVAACLSALAAPLDFDEPTYERAYRMADAYSERVLQLDLVRVALYNVHQLARKPLIGGVLKRTQALANALGMSDLHRFLSVGYRAIQPVRDIYRFTETISMREQDRLDRIYDH